VVELATTLAIIGVLSALSYSFFESRRARAAGGSGVVEVASILSLTRSRALAEGQSTVFLLRPTEGDASILEYVAFVDTNGNFDPADTSGTIEAGDALIERRALPAGVKFVKDSRTLPSPFKQIQPTAATTCTFCDVKSSYVTVVFHSDGTAALGSKPKTYPYGGLFSLGFEAPQSSAGTTTDMRTFVVLTRTGAVYPFDRS
jgi:Tfp pilus assembly protein FimT